MHSCVIYSALLAVTFAYNFDDAAFNQELAADLRDLHSSFMVSNSHYRHRRDEEAVMMPPEKCRPRRKHLCCAEEAIEKMHDKEKEVKRACFRKIKEMGGEREEPQEVDPFRCDKMKKHRKEMTCVMECVGKDLEYLDSDGNPVDEKIADFIKTTFGTESWFVNELQDKVISMCLDEAKNVTLNRDTEDSESCNPAGVKLSHCLFREIQLNCPVDQIKDQKSCSRLQERLKKHGDFGPHPGPPPMGDEPDN